VPPRRVSLRLIREVTSAVGVSLTLTTPCASQAAGSPDPHRHAIAVSADAGTIPTVFGGGQCGDDGYNHTAELGLGVSALDRPRSIVIFGAELREHDVTRVRQAETRFRYRQDSTVQTPLSASVVTERIHPTWTTLRAGLELPWP